MTRPDGLLCRHHFCFGAYQHPDRMEWGRLRIWNDNALAPGAVRPPTPHGGFDVLTLVHSGHLRRLADDLKPARLDPGHAHLARTGVGMTLGVEGARKSGARYSEIWFRSESPTCGAARARLPAPGSGRVDRLASGIADEEAPLRLSAPARLLQAMLGAADGLTLALGGMRHAYLVVLSGGIEAGGRRLDPGDALAIADQEALPVIARAGGLFLLAQSD